jgi:hypothetical protein
MLQVGATGTNQQTNHCSALRAGRYSHGLRAALRVLVQARDFSFLHSVQTVQTVQTDSWAHPASYPMGTGGSFPGDRAAGA